MKEMRAKSRKVLHLVSGWDAVELIVQCLFFGFWQLVKILVKRSWKGNKRKVMSNTPPVELTVDPSVGTHCYIKIMGVKYHYVETGPKYGQTVLILGDAPDTRNKWGPNWPRVVKQLADSGHHVVTLDIRGTGGSEGGGRADHSPPRAVEELTALMTALGVSENNPAVVIGLGIGGLLTWYLVHCSGQMISKFAVIGAPHPNLYWQNPPAAFCQRGLHFIQWPYFPERWLAEADGQDGERRWANSRATDWTGALNYVRGAAWWKVRSDHKISAPALLVGTRHAAAQLVSSAQYCVTSTLRLVETPDASDKDLPGIILDFLIEKEKSEKAEPKSLMGRMFAMAGRGRELTARLVLPPTQA